MPAKTLTGKNPVSSYAIGKLEGDEMIEYTEWIAIGRDRKASLNMRLRAHHFILSRASCVGSAIALEQISLGLADIALALAEQRAKEDLG